MENERSPVRKVAIVPRRRYTLRFIYPFVMAIKKSALYSSLWGSWDELRGGMDASQYKDYALALLFVKDVSDEYAGRAIRR